MSPASPPSPLAAAITAYVARQRSLGFKYRNEARILQEVDAFLAEHDPSELTGQLEPTPHSPLRPHAYRWGVVLLYTAGLRRGELLRLRIGAYGPSRHTVLVSVSKFRKSRIVALSPDAWREVDSYLRLRLGFPHTASSLLLAHGSRADRAFSGSTFGKGFRKLCRDASVLTDSGRPPRVHDVSPCRYLLEPLRLLPAGATVAGRDSLPAGTQCLSPRTRRSG